MPRDEFDQHGTNAANACVDTCQRASDRSPSSQSTSSNNAFESASREGAPVSETEVRLREALAKAEQGNRTLEALMQSIPEGITIADAEGVTIRMVSRYGQELLGASHTELTAEEVARRWTVLQPDGEQPMSTEDLPLTRAIRRGEIVRNAELIQVNAEGQRLHLSCNAAPIRDEHGNTLGGVVAWRDITSEKLAEKALKESEGRFRDLFTSMIEGFAVHEIICNDTGEPVDYRFLELNPAFERLTGLKRSDVIGKTHNEVLPGNDSKWVKIYGNVALTGVPTQFDSYSPALDRHYEVIAFRPAPGRFATIFADVTERKNAERALRESEERSRRQLEELQTIYDSAHVGLCVFDRDMRYVRINRRLAEINGIPAEAHIGKTVDEVMPSFAVTAHEIANRIFSTGEGITDVEFTGVTPSQPGVVRYWVEQWLPLRDASGAIQGVNVVVEEVTDRKRAELALSEANRRLTDVDNRKNEFLAMLSHELRNPLSPIKNGVHILNRSAPDSVQARRAKEVIARQVDHVSRLVDDLLDITRITRNKIALQRSLLDINDLVKNVAEDQRCLFEQNGVELVVRLESAPVIVYGDSARLAQIISNLLQNAAKFTRTPGATVIEVERGASEVCLRVRDTGIGMEPETVERLFEPFVQADASLDRSKGGLGLGLALVKGLVELHHGQVSANSEGIGKGSEFVVRLPTASGVPEEEAVHVPHPESGMQQRVLIIEDNVDAADTLRELLLFGHREVEVAYDGIDGLEKARWFRPDVVLCDIGLPGMDGFEVARNFRSSEELKDVPLVALTGYALPEDLQKSAEAGFDRHLAKPPSLPQIESLLAELR